MSIRRKKILSIITLALTTSLVMPSKIYSANKTVFIDAGHGGHDNGSSRNGYMEDDINLKIANLVAKKLKNNNINFRFSRESDTYVSLSKRTKMANSSGANLFVSIHQNASESKSPKGIETYYMGNNKTLAKIMHENLIENTGAVNRGTKSSSLQVLRDNKLPAVLIECGFISNPTERYRLSTDSYQEKVANGIVEGIKDYFNMNTNSSSNSNTAISTNSSNYKTVLNSVNVMSDRDKNSTVIGKLPVGTKVQVIDSKYDWLKINYNGKYGYVSSVYVK